MNNHGSGVTAHVSRYKTGPRLAINYTYIRVTKNKQLGTPRAKHIYLRTRLALHVYTSYEDMIQPPTPDRVFPYNVLSYLFSNRCSLESSREWMPGVWRARWVGERGTMEREKEKKGGVGSRLESLRRAVHSLVPEHGMLVAEVGGQLSTFKHEWEGVGLTKWLMREGFRVPQEHLGPRWVFPRLRPPVHDRRDTHAPSWRADDRRFSGMFSEAPAQAPLPSRRCSDIAAAPSLDARELARRAERSAKFGTAPPSLSSATMPPLNPNSASSSESSESHAKQPAPERSELNFTPRERQPAYDHQAVQKRPASERIELNVTPRERQLAYLDALTDDTVRVVLCIGVSGAGKTLCAVKEALEWLWHGAEQALK